MFSNQNVIIFLIFLVVLYLVYKYYLSSKAAVPGATSQNANSSLGVSELFEQYGEPRLASGAGYFY